METSELTENEAGKRGLLYAPTAGMLLVKIGRVAERWFTDALKPIGLTPRHLGVLLEVRARPTSQQALIDTIGVDPSKLVGLLNDLEADGLIVRRRDPEDRRRGSQPGIRRQRQRGWRPSRRAVRPPMRPSPRHSPPVSPRR